MRDEKLTVYYPSGYTLRLFGRFVKHGRVCHKKNGRYGVAIESLESVPVPGDDLASPGSILLLDPRGVVVGEQSGVLYSPRPHLPDLPDEIQEWMECNPDWPSRLNLEAVA